ncbi:WXG100 family type VII secretion target [Amycolatopsis pithecellobii]|uniref:WXG100 family type VII secretion target n=1 Tax=Amycolatopsis pithecellobii TaxID=664692 RepID=UPI00140E671D|nr:hypothetical protein [Amycolatopsis pithecellobii]
MVTVLGRGGEATPPPPQPPPDLPNLDQVLTIVGADSPERWYQQASKFDQVNQRVGDVSDQFRREFKNFGELWHGNAAGAYGGQADRLAGLVDQLQQNPDYGGLLRRAGDALSMAQQRLGDLQAQRAGGGDPALLDQQARQILNDLATAYGDIGQWIGQGITADEVTSATNTPPPPYAGAEQEQQGGGGAAQGGGHGGGATGHGTHDPAAGMGPMFVVGATGQQLGATGQPGAPGPAGVLGRTGTTGTTTQIGRHPGVGRHSGEVQLTGDGRLTGAEAGPLGVSSATGGQERPMGAHRRKDDDCETDEQPAGWLPGNDGAATSALGRPAPRRQAPKSDEQGHLEHKRSKKPQEHEEKKKDNTEQAEDQTTPEAQESPAIPVTSSAPAPAAHHSAPLTAQATPVSHTVVPGHHGPAPLAAQAAPVPPSTMAGGVTPPAPAGPEMTPAAQLSPAHPVPPGPGPAGPPPVPNTGPAGHSPVPHMPPGMGPAGASPAPHMPPPGPGPSGPHLAQGPGPSAPHLPSSPGPTGHEAVTPVAPRPGPTTPPVHNLAGLSASSTEGTVAPVNRANPETHAGQAPAPHGMSGQGMPMTPMSGARGMPERTNPAHDPSGSLHADPDAWGGGDIPQAVLGRPRPAPLPPPQPPEPGPDNKTEGENDG